MYIVIASIYRCAANVLLICTMYDYFEFESVYLNFSYFLGIIISLFCVIVGVSPDVFSYHIRPIHTAFYEDLYSTVAEQFEELSSSEQHLSLLTTGKTLQYSDYNPGRNFDGSLTTVPQDVLENIFKLVDIIPKGNLTVTHLKDVQSLSETYEYLVRQLRVIPPDVAQDEMQEAREYLQEKVEDLGNADLNLTQPRLSLYIKYKTRYYEKKLGVEDQIDAQKTFLTGYSFSDWYDRHSLLLHGQVEDAYVQWVMFGYKNEVEKWLKLLQLQDTESSPIDFSESLEEAKTLLIATKERSMFKEDSMYRPAKLLPDYWFKILENRFVLSVLFFLPLQTRIMHTPMHTIHTHTHTHTHTYILIFFGDVRKSSNA